MIQGGLYEESAISLRAKREAKINKAFGGQLENVLLELNEYLYDDGGKPA